MSVVAKYISRYLTGLTKKGLLSLISWYVMCCVHTFILELNHPKKMTYEVTMPRNKR